jgi:hypothetical protein
MWVRHRLVESRKLMELYNCDEEKGRAHMKSRLIRVAATTILAVSLQLAAGKAVAPSLHLSPSKATLCCAF